MEKVANEGLSWPSGPGFASQHPAGAARSSGHREVLADLDFRGDLQSGRLERRPRLRTTGRQEQDIRFEDHEVEPVAATTWMHPLRR